MTRLCFFVILVLILTPACKRQEGVRVTETDERPATLTSVIHVADPQAVPQLLRGFHSVEQSAWRWTMQRFAVVLRPPAGATENGALLNLRLSVPEPVIDKLRTISLSAAIAGSTLAPESYTQPGEFTYTREIPPKLLAGEAVNVEFTLDKALPPSGADQRELGVVVASVGLESK